MDYYGFYTGACFDAYEYLGCHLEEGGAVVRTFAPAAVRVELMGEFNGWQPAPMEKIYDGNFWEGRAPGAVPGMQYKLRIWRRDGSYRDHCDPYGFGMELRPNTASIIRDLGAYTFGDQEWRSRRAGGPDQPVNIYEVHLGSWRRRSGEETGWYNYRELADPLIDYAREHGFQYLEFMPLSEHPSDQSWGYQNTGFFSPTARYGTAEDLMYLVDRCHQRGVGVIMDFVPVHFAVDDYALAMYDGTALYEYPHTDVGVSEWGSRNFNHARGEVRSFLQSAARYWLREFHFDGLRMDAVRNLIYWQGDERRGENQNGLAFLREMNRGLKGEFPGALLMAEDSSAHRGITAPPEEGGLGFDYKWDLGWMHDTLEVLALPPADRPAAYDRLTFAMAYNRQEHYLLPLSHDEVVHGKGALVEKPWGDLSQRLAQSRCLVLYQYTFPGKKLNFMGNDLAAPREWNQGEELPWREEDPDRLAFRRFFRDMGRVYQAHPALWRWDYREEGFAWVTCASREEVALAFTRTDGKDTLLTVFQLSGAPAALRLPLEGFSRGEVLLDTNWAIYGGGRDGGQGEVLEWKEGELLLELPPMSGMLLRLG